MDVRPPNIIMILTDQQRADTLSFSGNPHMITPNLGRLGRQGMNFSACFAQGACCVPARASLFSGKYPHQLGLLTNAPWDGEDNWVSHLSEAGYQTVSIGKMHLHPWRAPCGFEYRFVCENKNQPFRGGEEPDEWVKSLAIHGLERPLDYHNTLPDFDQRMGDVEFPLPEEFHEDVFIGRKAVEFVEKRDDHRPLFLHIGFAGPHDPYDAPERYKEMYAGRGIPLPDAAPGELENKPPEQLEKMRRQESLPTCIQIKLSKATPEQLRRMRAAYYANITLIDEWIGNVLGALKRRGLLDNSVVVFASDHGDALGDNNMIHKWFMYDSMTRVPMLLWGPGRIAPGETDKLIELQDLGPTLLEMAGVKPPGDMQAESFLPALKGDGSFEGRQYVFCEEKHLAMVSSAEWKLVHYHGRPYGELYDLRGDPGEHRNLWDEPGAADIKTELHDILKEWYARTGGYPEQLRRYVE